MFVVPDACPADAPIQECSTCCCESSDNVEFYDPDAPEPECTAPPALYEMTFVTTWTEVCQPDYYFGDDSQWASPIVTSHSPVYRLWDACMDMVTDDFSSDSQDENSVELGRGELLNAILAGSAVDVVRDAPITQGNGTSTSVIVVDKFHQFVSAFSRQVPSLDYIVGVADLRLCNGDEWKESVKVCFELFSTATASERVAPEMMRNSVQGNNCSYGYVEFSFLTSQVSLLTVKL